MGLKTYLAIATLLIPIQAALADSPKKTKLRPNVIVSERHDVSPPISHIPPGRVPQPPKMKDTTSPPKRLGKYQNARNTTLQGDPDGALQLGPVVPNIPAPLATYEGLDANGYYPPDTVGDVGPNHYVQMVNVQFMVMNKSGGILIPGTSINTIWDGFGGDCESHNDGDPIVLYDPLADRWLLSQFTSTNYECIAISTTGDPTGSYYRYAFLWPNGTFPDYPHFGVWPDGYYMSVNQFGTNVYGVGAAAAFERDQMLIGGNARLVYFDLGTVNTCYGGMMPSDLDGIPPPLGSPNYFVEMDDSAYSCPTIGSPDSLKIWKYTVYWEDPSLSTFGKDGQPDFVINTATYDSLLDCGSGRDCIPQNGTTEKLDAISDRIMFRLQYRNFGTHESLVANHTVDAGGDIAGIRWYEIRDPNGNPFLYQQGTFAGAPPDGIERWMGSIAMDNDGNMALGYSASSSSIYPGIRYAGRLATDPLGSMSQGESVLIAGGGAQTGTASRWGDYSAMTVDPVDDCTFWYTSEYYSATSPAGWQTRIGKFRFSQCTQPPAAGTLVGVVTDAGSGLPIPNASIKTPDGYVRTTDANGQYSMNLPAGTYSATASAAGHVSSTANGVVVMSGVQTVQNFVLATKPYLVLFGVIEQGGNGNGTLEIDECETLYITLLNSGGMTATGITATLTTTTQGVAILQGESSYPNIPPFGSAVNSTAFQIRSLSNYVCGTSAAMTVSVTTDQGNFSIPLNLNAGPPVFAFSASDVPRTIFDLSTTNSVVAVSGIAAPITKVTVSLQLFHTFDADLDISLIGPDGTIVDLSSDNGGSGDNYGSNCINRTVFDDSAVTLITSGAAPFIGTFKPEQALSAFAGKSGSSVNGNWTLRVVDDAGGDTGTLVCWTLTITTSCADVNCNLPNLSYLGASVNDSSGNSNLRIDPNECLSLPVAIKNTGAGTATGITATLSTTTPGVTITQPNTTFADLPGGLNGAALIPFGLTTSSGFVCGTKIQLTLNINSAEGTYVSKFSLNSGLASATTWTSIDVPKAIPDQVLNGVDSNVSVSGITGNISNLNVRFHITHPRDRQLSIGLVAPDQSGIFVVNNVGEDGDNFGTDCPDSSNDTTLSDSASATLVSGSAPFAGLYKPQVPLSYFNGKTGSAVNGTWKLRVKDPYVNFTGTLECWSMTLTTSTCTAAPGACSASGEPNPLMWNGKSSLNWGGVAGSTGYNVYRGVQADLPELLTAEDDSCKRWSGVSTGTGSVLNETPPPGEVYWYIVRSVNAGGEGTAGNATSGPRIQNSTGNCP